MTRFPLLCAAIVGLLLLPIAAEGARGTYIDRNHGFSIKLQRGWSQTPLKPGETTEVGKWKDDRKGDFATLSIYRFQTSSAEVTPGEDGDGLPQIPQRWSGMPDNAQGYLEALHDRIKQSLVSRARRSAVEVNVEELAEPRTVKFGKVEGQLYLHTFEPVRKLYFSGEFWAAGIIEGEGEEYLILYRCPPNRAKKLKMPFVQSIRSFRLPGDDTATAKEDDPDDRGRATVDEKDLLDPEKRARIKLGLVGSWRFIDTRHYIVIYNCDRKLAEYIAKRVEYMRVNAFEVVFPPVEPIQECGVIRICKEMDEYHHYGGPRGSAGYWSSGHDELVFPDLSQSSKPDQKTVGVMHHEGFHQYIYYALLKHNPPVWFNEGFAEYFFCINFKNWSKKLKFDKRHPMRSGTVKTALATGKLMPIKDFIRLTQRQYYQQAQLFYSQGWAFSTWLKNYTRNERYQKIPEIFFREMQKGYLEAAQGAADGLPPGFPPGAFGRDNPVTTTALEKAFEGIDLDQLNKDFLKGIKRHM